MTEKIVHARVSPDLHDKVKGFAKSSGQSVSAAFSDLALRGLEKEGLDSAIKDLRNQVEDLKKQVSAMKEASVALESDKATLQAKLMTSQVKENLALQAKNHMASVLQDVQRLQLQNQEMWQFLSICAGYCPQCNQPLRLYDIGRKSCPNCKSTVAKLYDGYNPPPTAGEIIWNGLAIAGTVVAVKAILDALNGNDR